MKIKKVQTLKMSLSQNQIVLNANVQTVPIYKQTIFINYKSRQNPSYPTERDDKQKILYDL